MIVRWLFAAAHLLALGIGLGSVWARGRALNGELDATGLKRVFYADALWGLAAVLWIGTGLVRAFSNLEKGAPYYLQNHNFWTKMILLAVILVLEFAPMVALIRWRIALKRGTQPDTSAAGRFATVSFVQAWLVIVMVLLATAMARGVGR